MAKAVCEKGKGKPTGPTQRQLTPASPARVEEAAPPTHGWIRRSAYLARKIRGGVDPYQAEQEIRDELINGLPFQYIGIDGRQYTNDLPARYAWDDPEFGSDDSVAWPKETVGEPLTGPLAHIAEQIRESNLVADVALGRRPPLRRRLDIYRLELWVPAEGVSKPTTAVPPSLIQPAGVSDLLWAVVLMVTELKADPLLATIYQPALVDEVNNRFRAKKIQRTVSLRTVQRAFKVLQNLPH